MKKAIPFDFLLDYLPANVVIRPAIGMFYIYWEGKIVLMFRKLNRNAHHNGIWISTKREHHDSLQTAITAITEFVFNEDEVFDTAWLLLSDDHDDFETAAILLCGLVSQRDQRIGKATAKAAELTRQAN
jgi:hypothetical protein